MCREGEEKEEEEEEVEEEEGEEEERADSHSSSSWVVKRDDEWRGGYEGGEKLTGRAVFLHLHYVFTTNLTYDRFLPFE